jgi:hypothetical protein
MRSISGATCCGPAGASTPNSAMWPRMALMSVTRWRDSSSWVRWMTLAACCSTVLSGVVRTLGRVTASQIAAASAASFFWRAT